MRYIEPDSSAPVYKSQSDTVALSLAGGLFHLGDPLTLSSGVPVPTDLYRMELSAQYYHQFPESKTLSLRSSIGYAGDEPFKNSSDTTGRHRAEARAMAETVFCKCGAASFREKRSLRFGRGVT